MNKDNILKIGLIGSAGLGKSGVASKLEQALDLIFLKSKEITRPLLKKYNYDYSRGECVEKFLSKKEIEYEIVDTKINQENLMTGGFITDRTTLECFAYALLSVEKYSDDEIELLEKICSKNMEKYTHLFYFPYMNGWLEDNGVRTVSTYFQRKIDMIIRGLMDDWGIEVITVNDENPVEFIKSKLK